MFVSVKGPDCYYTGLTTLWNGFIQRYTADMYRCGQSLQAPMTEPQILLCSIVTFKLDKNSPKPWFPLSTVPQ